MNEMRGQRSRTAVGVVVLAIIVGLTVPVPVGAAPVPPIIHVAPTGSDAEGCGSEQSPCQTIQHAVDIASSFDEIRVAEGIYHYSGAAVFAPCYGGTPNPPVVCILNKELVLLGGFTPSDWVNADPVAHPTVIDGENQRRGLLLQRTGTSEPAASLHLEGFVFENGLAKGPDGQSGDTTFAFGGGLIADLSPITVKNVTFRTNQAIGGSTSAESYGGAGAGGGAAVRSAPVATFENVTFEYNQALGGSGRERGGLGIGGGIFLARTPFYGRNLTFTNNTAAAGHSSGSGISIWRADSHGGGAAFHEGSVDLQYVVARNNQAIGGDAGTYGGGAYGGAFMVQSGTFPGSIVLRDAELRDNFAIGGDACNGGDAKGGAMETSNAPATLERVRAIHNTARGGNGTPDGNMGGPGGGGFDFGGNAHVSILNSIIADNAAEIAQTGAEPAGGGGGLWLYGVDADIVHTTLARNRLQSDRNQGEAVVMLQGASANFSYCIIEGHNSEPAASALHVQAGNRAELQYTLWANNLRNSNAGQPGAGIIIDFNPIIASSAGFLSPGAPNYDYHLSAGSPALDRATGSTTTTDIDNETRPAGVADIGADEWRQLALSLSLSRPSSGTFQLSWQANANLAAVVDHYEVILQCMAGAHPPEQMACNTPLDVGLQTELVLTHLSDGKIYTVVVEAHTALREVLVSASREAAPGIFVHTFLPMVTR